MTTELPRMTTMPSRWRSPPGFSSTASSRTMFKKTCIPNKIMLSVRLAMRLPFSGETVYWPPVNGVENVHHILSVYQ